MLMDNALAVDVEALRSRMEGTVAAPGDQAYDEVRQAWNLAVDQRPALVAVPATVDEVVEVVNFARERGLRVAAQGTGHAASALAQASLHDTILVKTHRMRVVEVDPDSRRVQAQAGALWADVVGPASEHGLAALAGSSPDVGVTGYTLGGGVSSLSRRHGLAAQSVQAAEVVTADGRLLRADAGHEPELFWALRGGGGSFAAATVLEIRLIPFRQATAGLLFFPLDRAAEVAGLGRGRARGDVELRAAASVPAAAAYPGAAARPVVCRRRGGAPGFRGRHRRIARSAARTAADP